MVDALDPASVRAAELGAKAILPLGFDEWFRAAWPEIRAPASTVEAAFHARRVIPHDRSAAPSGTLLPRLADADRPRCSGRRRGSAAQKAGPPALRDLTSLRWLAAMGPRASAGVWRYHFQTSGPGRALVPERKSSSAARRG